MRWSGSFAWWVMRKQGLKEQGDERILDNGEYGLSLAETAWQLGVKTNAIFSEVRKNGCSSDYCLMRIAFCRSFSKLEEKPYA